ncbi:hypothetical protein [uncultured Veillonella sp.]|uniref:hypothetical protein n=1 Tax=uncultured Veillonella sp. TaxID=159268 RepID=UPI0026250B1E|nr:hypothetical protein [uncultured Veillonella sp.]
MRKSNDYDFGCKVYAALSSVLTADSTMLDIGAGQVLLRFLLLNILNLLQP